MSEPFVTNCADTSQIKCEQNSQLSNNSVDSINQCVDILSKCDNKKEFPIHIEVNPYISESVKDKLSQLMNETKTVTLKKKANKLKQYFPKEIPINKTIYNDQLQKKKKKMLFGLISQKIKNESDLEDFKNQLEFYSPKKQSPFGLLDFEKKFRDIRNRNGGFEKRTYYTSTNASYKEL